MIKLKKRLIYSAFVFLSIGSLSFYSCVEHNVGAQPHPVDCANVTTIHYSDTTEGNSVQDIIAANCLLSGCHGDDPGLPDWSQFDELQDEDHQAEIKRRTTLPDTDPDKMPRKGSITQEEREIIYCWIEQGAQDN